MVPIRIQEGIVLQCQGGSAETTTMRVIQYQQLKLVDAMNFPPMVESRTTPSDLKINADKLSALDIFIPVVGGKRSLDAILTG